ncbi:NIPSNAP family protein [Olivibacter sp. XZL3]|uniref:NIPSNAP family protein n=1 Tax=Olivibacter sp. XZL3 TaxID=1735116 RepID=UPI0010666978|nr:NIPSNAP family protein [Olivibacter sp. XZL3]
MKPTKFLFALLFFLIPVSSILAEVRDFYVIKIYHLENEEQERRVDDYLKTAYLPALHRLNVSHIGVFKPLETDEKRIYVFIPFKSINEYLQLESALAKDQSYLQLGKDYLEASHDNPPYTRIESILLKAFEEHPLFSIPSLTGPREKRVYELRSYEGPTEKLYRNKVDMFNKGDEIALFKRLGFNAVFYGEVLAGSKMPNLMYLTTFEDKKSRDEHWDAFGKDAYWKKLSAMPIYQNNVSHADIVFLYPTAYSDF